jgi:hypothetical protein
VSEIFEQKQKHAQKVKFSLLFSSFRQSTKALGMEFIDETFAVAFYANNEWGSGDIVGKIDGNVVFELAAGESLRGEGKLWETFDCYGKVLVGKLKGKVDEASEI